MTAASLATTTRPVTLLAVAVTLTAAAVTLARGATADDGGRRTVLYPKFKSGGLVCYKHRGTDGGAFWTHSTEPERRPYVFHCPSSLSTWCVNVATGPLSVRGCSGPTGVNRGGCFHVVDPQLNATSKVCLCRRNYCNAAAAGPSSVVRWSWTVALVVSLSAGWSR